MDPPLTSSRPSGSGGGEESRGSWGLPDGTGSGRRQGGGCSLGKKARDPMGEWLAAACLCLPPATREMGGDEGSDVPRDSCGCSTEIEIE